MQRQLTLHQQILSHKIFQTIYRQNEQNEHSFNCQYTRATLVSWLAECHETVLDFFSARDVRVTAKKAGTETYKIIHWYHHSHTHNHSVGLENNISRIDCVALFRSAHVGRMLRGNSTDELLCGCLPHHHSHLSPINQLRWVIIIINRLLPIFKK